MTKHKWHDEIKAWADGAEIEEFKEALEQSVVKDSLTVQKPVAWVETYKGKPNNIAFNKTDLTKSEHKEVVPLYTHPKQWQGLSDDEIYEIDHNMAFARIIEAKLKEKNT